MGKKEKMGEKKNLCASPSFNNYHMILDINLYKQKRARKGIMGTDLLDDHLTVSAFPRRRSPRDHHLQRLLSRAIHPQRLTNKLQRHQEISRTAKRKGRNHREPTLGLGFLFQEVLNSTLR